MLPWPWHLSHRLQHLPNFGTCRKLTEAEQQLSRTIELREDAERRAASEHTKALDLSSRVSTLETRLEETQQLCDDKAARLSEALNAAQAELAEAREQVRRLQAELGGAYLTSINTTGAKMLPGGL